MGIESVLRLASPRPIQFNEAVLVAALGLLVNVACAWIIGSHHTHARDHDHGHEHGHHHHDLNLKSAYVHIVADALTSILAIAALLSGKYFGWNWLDPVMGIVGGVLIGVWAVNLIRETSRVLLDCEMDRPLVGEIKASIARLTCVARRPMSIRMYRECRHGRSSPHPCPRESAFGRTRRAGARYG
jgi:cation diffusion facilitator family transporter